MYLPYLRGKQYELIALRQVVPILQASGRISPIVEPVKQSHATLIRTLDAFKEANVNFTIILNPRVGDFSQNHDQLAEEIIAAIGAYTNFQFGLIADSRQGIPELLAFSQRFIPNGASVNLIHLQAANLDRMEEFADNYNLVYNLIHYSITDRRYGRKLVNGEKVRLDNPFNSQAKNADYAIQEDESFTMEHRYFEEDGYGGFADYLTIGDDYQEAGFLPYAVAFHITYAQNDEIRVRHFVSDSNFDNTDVPGKFSEALQKFHNFNEERHLGTSGADELERYYEEQHYPGLGVLKKISVVNHIELISRCLQ